MLHAGLAMLANAVPPAPCDAGHAEPAAVKGAEGVGGAIAVTPVVLDAEHLGILPFRASKGQEIIYSADQAAKVRSDLLQPAARGQKVSIQLLPACWQTKGIISRYISGHSYHHAVHACITMISMDRLTYQ